MMVHTTFIQAPLSLLKARLIIKNGWLANGPTEIKKVKFK